VLSLALGIGANTGIFTLINALLLRSLPVRDPQGLVEISAVRRNGKTPFSYPMFRELERGQRVFSGLTGWSSRGMCNVEVNGEFSPGQVRAVTGDYYSVLGVSPLVGRLIAPEDVSPAGASTSQVALLGYEFWQRRLGGASDVVGKQVRIEGQAFTIIGVTRKWFAGMTAGEPADITFPVTAQQLISGDGFAIDDRSVLWLFVTGRLKDGVTVVQARAQLESFWPEVLAATVSTATPGPRRDAFLGMGVDVAPAASGVVTGLRSQFTRPLYILLGVVGLILLVACVNLANLLLARCAARRREMSVRVALGASPWLLVRLVLMECVTLSAGGAVLGLGFAYWGSRWLVTIITRQYSGPVALDLRPDGLVLGLTGVVAVLTGILFGLAPALRASRGDATSMLRQDGRGLAFERGGSLGKALIISQVALSVVLLLGAGILIRTFQKLNSVNLGFKREGLVEVSLSPVPGGYTNLDISTYHTQLIDRIAGLPGVRSVGFSNHLAPDPEGWRDSVSSLPADESGGAAAMANVMMVSPGFFRTLGIGLKSGRDFEWSDDNRHSPVSVLSSGLADRLFADGRPIGQRLRFGVMPDLQALEVIAVAENARVADLRDDAAYAVYVPSSQHPAWSRGGGLLIRTDGAPDAIGRTVAQEIKSLGHEYALSSKTIAQVAGQLLVPQSVTATLSGLFAGLSLLLASIGLYGLMSYTVTGRTREFGIRAALGARRKRILWDVLRETLGLMLAGLAIGLPCAWAGGKVIAGMLYGVSPIDLPTVAVVSLLLMIVTLAAGYLPARRASGVDPIAALRFE
jgi:predicted permease